MSKSIEEHLRELTRVVDRLGMPIDEEIMLPVAAIRLHGFNTTSSCQGHLDRSTGGPYIVVSSSEELHYEQKMRESGLDSPQFITTRNELKEKNLIERERIQTLLDEFYEDHESKNKIYIKNIGPGTSKLRCEGVEEAETSSLEEKEIWLQAARLEFSNFANWLMAKKSI